MVFEFFFAAVCPNVIEYLNEHEYSHPGAGISSPTSANAAGGFLIGPL
jgi:hypothetical protein